MELNIKIRAMVHSIKAQAEVTILEKTGDNQYVAEYNGTKCSAIFNPFAGMYYVDDVYGVISSEGGHNLGNYLT